MRWEANSAPAMLHRTLAALALLLTAACSTLPPPTAAAPQWGPERGIVSAADPRGAEAGAAMLRQGGSATDAAIATMLALTVVEPQSSGIGGGGFLIHAAADGTVETLDGRESAPAAATPARFLDAQGQPLPFPEAVIGGLSVGVPGNIALAAEAHRRHGVLPWAALFDPAIALARDGYQVTERMREFLVRAQNRAALDPVGRQLFYDSAGEAVPAGTLVRNPQLAATLELIAQGGPEAFQRGDLAREMAEAIAAATPRDGRMTAADIAAYRALEREPVCGAYRIYRICGMGPPSSGATTVLAILKQLEHFDLAALGPRSPVSWHLFAESQRLAYADRDRYLADSDFVAVPVAGLTNPAYLAARGALIAADARMAMVEPGTPAGIASLPPPGEGPVESGTTHFAVVDRQGNVISYTSTIEGSFGSGLMVGGFYLNNELTDFSFVPEVEGRAVANRVEGGKRPRSSMAPTIVFDAAGEPLLAIGAAGGATIPVQVAKALIGVLDWGLDAREAIALPGLFAPGDGVAIEQGSWLAELRPQLEALGHQVSERALPFKANAVERGPNGWSGAADPRSDGVAVAE